MYAMAGSVSRTCGNILRNFWIKLWINKSKKKKIYYQEIDDINKSGENAIYFYQQIIDYIVNEYKKEDPNDPNNKNVNIFMNESNLGPEDYSKNLSKMEFKNHSINSSLRSLSRGEDFISNIIWIWYWTYFRNGKKKY